MSSAKISRFKGLNNVSDPLSIGLSWFTLADNVDVTDTGALSARRGFTRVGTSTPTSGYTTLDNKRTYLVAGGMINRFDAAMTLRAIQAITSAAPMYFTEVNEQVFYSNGTDYGIINPDDSWRAWSWPNPDSPLLAYGGEGVLPAGQYQVLCTFLFNDGRETGTSDPAFIQLQTNSSLLLTGIPQVAGLRTVVYIASANSSTLQFAFEATSSAMTWNASPEQLGQDVVTMELAPVPVGSTIVQHWRGRIYAAQYMPAQDQTAVWASEALGFHLFQTNEQLTLVPGEVVMLAPHKDALVIGTRSTIYSFDEEEMKVLATYGAVPGHAWVRDGNDVLIWTERGLCSAIPFENKTDRQVSVPPGVLAGAALVEREGTKRFVVALRKGGTAYNVRP